MGAKTMKNQVQPLLAAVLLSGAMSLGFAGEGFAEDATSDWYSHGFVKLGGLVFIDRPAVGERSKFEEYGEVSPGFIIDTAHLEFGSRDMLRVAEIWADDLTQNDRNVSASLSSAGNHYLDLEFDQTPHLYRNRAFTLHDGVGTGTLTVDDAVQTALQAAQFAGDTAAIDATIAANVRPVTLDVDRKAGKLAFRYTPTPQWDLNFNYSLEQRDGTLPMGQVIGMTHTIVRGSPGIVEGMVEIPAPVDYTTHNFGASVEYKMDLGDDRKWITNLSYGGSIFENKYDSVTWDNPFRINYDLSPFSTGVGGILPGEDGSPVGRASLPPDNYAHRVMLQTAADIWEKTRFTGTVSYNAMRQDEALLPWTVNDPLFALNPLPLPADSANAEINTLTIDTKLTTRALHPDLTNTLRYRYYSSDNDTPRLYFPDRIAFDSEYADDTYINLAPSYVKQNAGFDTVWRADDWVTLGFLLGWEQYDRGIGREADITNEYSGKLTADMQLHPWMSVRGSAYYSQRRYDNYDYLNRIDRPGSLVGDETESGSTNYRLIRKYSMSNRDRFKLELSSEIGPFQGVTFTPLVGWRDDDYDLPCTPDFALARPYDPCHQGLLYDRSWDAGVELNYMTGERTSLFGSYVHEDFDRRIRNRGYGVGGHADIEEAVDTFMAGLNVALIPDSVDLKLAYTYARGEEVWVPDVFPVVNTRFHRFDASLKYTLPEETTQGTGLSKAFAKIQYAYERNRIDNWALNEDVYVPTLASSTIWLAGREANYDAQIVTLSVGLGW